MKPKLQTETNTPEMESRAQSAASEILANTSHEVNMHFEHGQWWVTCNCGAAWSVVDAEGGKSVDGFDLEEVSEGDEEYHDEQ